MTEIHTKIYSFHVREQVNDQACAVLRHSSHVRLFATPWTVAHQGSSVHGDSPGKNTGVPCPPPGDLSNPGIKPRSPSLQADSLLSKPPGKPSDQA